MNSRPSKIASRRRLITALVVGTALLSGCGSTGSGSSVAHDAASQSASLPSVASSDAGAPGTPTGGTVGTAADALAPGSATTSGTPLVPSGEQRNGANPPAGLGFTAATPGWVTSFRGVASGVTARVVVWLPPEYGQPAYVHRSFPVVELLGGFPANVFGWMHGADVVSAYYRARAAGMPPAILVAAEINVEGATDLECLDAPGHPAVETWVTRDVPAFIQAHFRAARPGGWGIMGFSLGGFCAPYLALTHPEVYAAAVAINGYFAASSAQLPAAFLRDHSVLQAVRSRPAVSILWTTTRRDTSSPTGWGKILQKAAAPPTQVVVEIVDGVGHGTKQWRPFVWSHLRWLVARLPRA